VRASRTTRRAPRRARKAVAIVVAVPWLSIGFLLCTASDAIAAFAENQGRITRITQIKGTDYTEKATITVVKSDVLFDIEFIFRVIRSP
jgi:hypothetical protein